MDTFNLTMFFFQAHLLRQITKKHSIAGTVKNVEEVYRLGA
ncbi:MAG: hypothetical protein ACYC6Q_09245 [Syntrophales bacterium]